jgi:hypothetical protein
VAHPLLGLHLRDLQRTGVLTEVFASVGEVGRGLAARKRTQGESVTSRGPCSAPLALVPLLATAVMSPLPQQPVRWGRGTMERTTAVVFSGQGKRVAGVNGGHFI